MKTGQLVVLIIGRAEEVASTAILMKPLRFTFLTPRDTLLIGKIHAFVRRKRSL